MAFAGHRLGGLARQVLLLAPGGKLCYAGPTARLQGYFEERGVSFPDDTNPADVVLDALSNPRFVARWPFAPPPPEPWTALGLHSYARTVPSWVQRVLTLLERALLVQQRRGLELLLLSVTVLVEAVLLSLVVSASGGSKPDLTKVFLQNSMHGMSAPGGRPACTWGACALCIGAFRTRLPTSSRVRV